MNNKAQIEAGPSAVKINPVFIVTLLVITAFVILILFSGNDFYWLCLLAVSLVLQTRFKIAISNLFPLIAILSLTEFCFIFSGKRMYLCELIYIPLMINYILTNFLWRKFGITELNILLLIFLIIIFQALNFLFNYDLNSSFFRIRSLAFPLFLIIITSDLIKSKEDLRKTIKLILIVSALAAFVVYIQFFTGSFYILQDSSAAIDDLHFIEGYLSSTQDSYLFNLIGLNIKGPMPPVGMNYFKFGFSEKIIVAASLFFAYFKFYRNKNRYIYLIAFIILFFATLLTGSRSVLLTLLFIILIIHLFYKKKLRWGLIVFIIFFFFAITYLIGPLLSFINLPEFGTLASRIFYMEDFYRFIRGYLMVLFAGSSPEKYLNITSAPQPPHHFFAFGIVYDGLIITCILFFALYKLLKHTKRVKTFDKEIQSISYGLWASIFGFVFIYGQTSYLTWSIPHNMFFSIIIGLLIASYRLNKQYSENIDL